MQQIIFDYFNNLSDLQKSQFGILGSIYQNWNDKINVISRKDIDNLYLHHVLHSLAIAKVVQFMPATKILDLGTGGGFPGVPLAIMFPNANFLLVDSVGKKLKVVEAVAESLGLKNITTLHERVENIDGQFDFVVSRAVTRLDTVWGWVGNKIAPTSLHAIQNGLLYLKGDELTSELPKGVISQSWPISNFFSQEYFNHKMVIHIHV